MSRGDDNQPKHAPPGGECKVVLYQQDSHRSASRANGDGFIGGTAGVHWQSHHIVCISSVGGRTAKDAATKDKLEKSLYITDWNINKAPNMIGLPQRCWYRESYGDAEKAARKATSAAAAAAAWAAATPVNLTSHNNDHNTTGGYTDEVTKHLNDNIWNKFDANKGDHNADATWLKDQLEGASKHFDGVLKSRGSREPGTIDGWKERFNRDDWQDPFSMAARPTERSPGRSITDLTEIFKRLEP
ncbi:MAG: AHH domain-containing protein [Vicinamibacterales bacterium]